MIQYINKSNSSKFIFLFLILLLGCSSQEIPARIGDWRVEVGPPGNEFYQPPKPPSETKPPSEDLLEIVRLFAPTYTEIKEWELENDSLYQITAEAEHEEYDYFISTDGKVYGIEYQNDSTNVEEEADYLVIKGTKKSISLDKVPEEAMKTLTIAIPDTKPTQAWIASTIAGSRYVIVVGKMAFYARLDGQIQAAGLIKDGALNEIDEIYTKAKGSKEDILSEAKKLLGEYCKRFNFENQLKKLGKKPKSVDGHFRFVVIGDSRSNPDLWPNIVKHIDMIKPKPDFIINTGDIVFIGLSKEYYEYFIPPLLKLNIPLFVAIGNHDDGFNGMALEFRYLFGDNSLNYFFDYGNTRFIFFDNVSSVRPPVEIRDWLDNVLSDTPEDLHTIVAAHKPAGNIEKWSYHAMDKENSIPFTEFMSRYKVDHVFFGHIHAYSTATFNGIDYTVTGGGGAGLADRFGPQGNVHHYVICDVLPNGTLKQMVVRFYKDPGR